MEIEIQSETLTSFTPSSPKLLKKRLKKPEILSAVREVIELEANALTAMIEQIDDSFVDALNLMNDCAGKIVLTGVGKSGLIAKKIAATLTSTGTMATFLHPADGMHGDLGVVGENDVVIAIGKSGESEELTALLPAVKRIGAKIIAITARAESRLGKSADVALITPVDKEACPLNLAPTVSTTLALAVGDALAVALMKMKDFRSEDFARYHPGGKLGKRLLLHVSDLMIPLANCPKLDPATARMEDAIMALTEFGLGIVLFMKDENLVGILTDGDIRRLLQVHRTDLFEVPLSKVINPQPFTISSEILAVEALKFMEDRKRPLNVVPAVTHGKVVGVVRLHELLAVS